MHQAPGDAEASSSKSGCSGNGLPSGLIQTWWPKNWHLLFLYSCAVWGAELATHSICVQCDNSSVVVAVKKGSPRDNVVMHLLRCLWFFVAHYDIKLIPQHIPGVTNTTADNLSRCHMYSFLLQNPHASLTPSVIHPAIWQIISPRGLDRTLLQFKIWSCFSL